MKHSESTSRTRQSFAASLKKLASIQPLSKVTVSALLDDTGFNRNTFYYHFRDIYDLLHWTLEQEVFVVVEQLDLLSDFEEAINFSLDYINENAAFFSHISHSLGREALKDFFHADIDHVVTKIVADTIQQERVQVADSYRDFLIRFYADAIAGVLLDWIDAQGCGDRATIIAYLSVTLRAAVVGALHAGAIN